MKKLGGFLLMFLYGLAFAQNPLPIYSDNPHWNVVAYNGFGGQCGTFTYSLGPVTSIGSNTYFPVIECGLNCKTCGYYRAVGNKVYFRFNLGGMTPQEEQLEYDFGLNVGDTALCAYTYGDSSKFWVVNKANVTYQGTSRMTFTMNYYNQGYNSGSIHQMIWIEGIGSNYHAFQSLACLEPQCDNLQQLVKQTINGTITYVDTVLTFPYPCSSWVGLKENNNDPEIKIYPSVSHDEINIEVDREGEYIINNILGQRVISGSVQGADSKIDVSVLNAGLYFFTLKSGSRQYSSKFIKN